MIEPRKTTSAASPLPGWMIAMLLFAPAVLVLFAPRLGTILRDPLWGDVVSRASGKQIMAGDDNIVALDGDWRPGPGSGASLDDGATTAAITLTFPSGPWDELTVRVVGHPEAAWRLTTSRRFGPADDPMRQTIERRAIAEPLPNERERIVPFAAERTTTLGEGVVAARLELIEVPSPVGDLALLRRLEARVAARALNKVPHAPDYLALCVLPFALAMALWLAFAWGPARIGMAALGAGVLGAMVLRLGGERPDEQGTLWAFALASALFATTRGTAAAMGWWTLKRTDESARAMARTIAWTSALLVVALLAVEMRWPALEIARRSAPSPDAREFIELALRGGGLYNTTFAEWPFVREPLWVWMLRAWYLVAPDTIAAARVASALVAVVAMVVSAIVGARLFGPVVGIGAAMVLSTNPSWSEETARVLRLDMGMALLAAMMLLRADASMKPTQRAFAWGLAGAALLLLRLSAATLVLPVLAWEIARRRLAPRDAALAAFVIAVLVAPFLYASTFGGAGGDPLLAINTHAQYYTGTPGSFGDVVAGGSLVESARLHVVGAWDRFVWGPPRVRLFLGHEWLMLPGLVGVWVLLRGPHRWIAAWAVLWMAPYLAVAGMGASWRLGAEVHLVVAWVWMLGMEQLARWMIDAARRKPQGSAAISS